MSRDRLESGNAILYRNDRYHTNLEHVRAANLPFLVVALLSVWALGRIAFDRMTSILALALAGAMPPLLAHAGLATTDVAPTALVVAATVAFFCWIRKPSGSNAVLLALAAAIGLITKFSFPVFFAMAAIAIVVTTRGPRMWKVRAMHLIAVAVVSVATIAAAYRFRIGTINEARPEAFLPTSGDAVAAHYAEVPGYSWVRVDLMNRFWAYYKDAAAKGHPGVDFVDWAKAAGFPSPLARRHGDTIAGAPAVQPPSLADRAAEPFRAARQWFATRVPVFAPQFFAGAELVAWHSAIGHPAYLLGRFSWTGWWYYFPVVVFFKTPLAFIALALAGSVIAMRSGGARAGIAVAPLLMFIPAVTSKINIGVRHILPIYPFLCITAAVAAMAMWRSRRVARATVCALLVWYFAATSLAHPDYLAYFNELAGSHPERIALDSNLDWGQDLLRLGSLVAKRRIDRLHVAYFGSADWKRHVRQGEGLPESVPVDGWIAISEMKVASGKFDWLREYTPVAHAGKSIRLYYVTLH